MKARASIFKTVLYLLAISTSAACSEPGAPIPVCEEQAGHACVWLGQTGVEGYNGDGHHRLDTEIYWSMDLLFARDGTPWFIDWNNHLVRRVNPDQTVETIVGWSDPIFPGDGTGDTREKAGGGGADGSLVKLNHPTQLAEALDGSILVMAWHNHKLRRIDPVTSTVTILAGGGAGYAGDGATLATTLFRQPKSLIIDATGTSYIADQQNFRIRKIDAAGNVSTIAGVGTQGTGGDGGRALDAQFNWEAGSNPEPSGGLALRGDKLYVADTLSHKIRVVDLTTNMISTLAGTGAEGYSGDGGPASAATMSAPRGLEIGPEGDTLYFADTDNSVIRAISLTTGVIQTVVGTGEIGADEVDGLLATETKLRRPFDLTFDAGGDLYVMDTLNSRILKVSR